MDKNDFGQGSVIRVAEFQLDRSAHGREIGCFFKIEHEFSRL
jgi:hypothetical protein